MTPSINYLDKIAEQIAQELATEEGLKILDEDQFILDVKKAIILTVRARMVIGALEAQNVVAKPKKKK